MPRSETAVHGRGIVFIVFFSFVVFCSVFADLRLDAAVIGLRLSLRGIAAVRYHLPTQSSDITNADQTFAIKNVRHAQRPVFDYAGEVTVLVVLDVLSKPFTSLAVKYTIA